MQRGNAIAIRTLGPADRDLFRRMLTLFGEVFEEPGTYIHAQPDDAYIDALLRGDQLIALVALEDETVIGALAAYELKKFEQARSEIYIYDLAVDTRHRRKGVATALIEETTRIAAQRGAWTVFIQAEQGDEPPIALYSKLGTRQEVLHFDIAPSHRQADEPA